MSNAYLKHPAFTPWFAPGVRPVHVGVYQTIGADEQGGACYQYWNGERWGYANLTVELAESEAHMGASNYQNEKWRGLAVKP